MSAGLVVAAPEWRDIAGHPGYRVSDAGEVWSEKSGRTLKQQVTQRGYASVKLGTQKRHLVHRLVAAAFVPNPDDKPEVNHDDGVKLNNRATNLLWATQSENMLHAYRTGLQQPVRWSAERRAKQSAEQRGRKLSAETRGRIAAARKGKGRQPKTPEHVAKVAASLRRMYAERRSA